MTPEKIILCGSVVAAVITIVTACIKVIKVVVKINDWVETKERHDRENYLDIKRLIITSPNMPLHERLSAGEAYIKADGNGEVKKLYNQLLSEVEFKEE